MNKSFFSVNEIRLRAIAEIVNEFVNINEGHIHWECGPLLCKE